MDRFSSPRKGQIPDRFRQVWTGFRKNLPEPVRLPYLTKPGPHLTEGYACPMAEAECSCASLTLVQNLRPNAHCSNVTDYGCYEAEERTGEADTARAEARVEAEAEAKKQRQLELEKKQRAATARAQANKSRREAEAAVAASAEAAADAEAQARRHSSRAASSSRRTRAASTLTRSPRRT